MSRKRQRLTQNFLISREVMRQTVKQLGSLWVIEWLMHRLGITELIDQHCPVANQAGLSHGDVIAAMVANRLTAPRPLNRIEEWATDWAVEEVLGIPAHLLNDDRLGRALDAIFPHLDTLKGSIAWGAIEAFGIDTAVFHWDFTSFSFEGAYDEADQSDEGPQVTYGHSKAQRPDLKQVMVGLAVSADGGIPFNPTTLDGSAAEVAQVVAAMTALKKAARRDNFTLVGDTKLISKKNILAACGAGIHFCAPAPASADLRTAFRAIPREEFQPLTYCSEREQQKSQEARTSYLGTERTWVVTDPKHKVSHTLRQVFVISSEEQGACRTNRQRQMEKAEAVLRKVQSNLGTRWYDTAEKVRQKVTTTLLERRVSALYRIQIGEAAGKLTFHWEVDTDALATVEAQDGFYVLVTNLPIDQYDASAVLQLYKGQAKVERRFGDFKGPLAVNPLLLKDNRRIAALVFVIYLALLIFCLIERQARKSIEHPSGKVHGLYPGGQAVRPTGRNLLEPLMWLTLTITTTPAGPMIHPPALSPNQKLVHRLVGVPEPFVP